MFQRSAEEDRCPVFILILRGAHQGSRVHIMPGGHGEQILHGQCLQVLVRVGRRLFGEEADHLVGQLQLTLCDGKSHGCGGEGLADGVQHMWSLGVALAQPLLLEYLATLQHHYAVQILSRFLYRFQVGIERLV